MVDFGFEEERVKPKILINIGAGLDLPTAALITGRKGETIYNGGLAQVTGIVGAGNNYKSTIEHYMGLSAMSKVYEALGKSKITTYDTEINISIDRLEDLANAFPSLPNNIITGDTRLWTITDKSKIAANKWGMRIEDYSEKKIKDKESKCVFQPFTDPYTKEPLTGLVPTFAEIDSFTEFEGESTMEMLSGDLDSSDVNTSAVKQGNFKTKFTSILPRISTGANIYFFLVAHIGEKVDMSGGMSKYNQPTRKLQYLKQSDNIKGVGSKYSFLTNNLWFAHTASVLKNQTTKLPEYPIGPDDRSETELNSVKLTQLRGKNGLSGITLELVVSQRQGVLPSLTEFHFIKENGRFGLEGNNTHYSLDILPDISLSRTTVRGKLDSNPLLRRAVNITSELLQLLIFHPHLANEGLFCTPKELYDDIKKLGYDWELLLATRGYWTINQYDHPVPYLSTVDLLKMRVGKYFPYFLNEDKTLKKQYTKQIKESK